MKRAITAPMAREQFSFKGGRVVRGRQGTRDRRPSSSRPYPRSSFPAAVPALIHFSHSHSGFSHQGGDEKEDYHLETTAIPRCGEPPRRGPLWPKPSRRGNTVSLLMVLSFSNIIFESFCGLPTHISATRKVFDERLRARV